MKKFCHMLTLLAVAGGVMLGPSVRAQTDTRIPVKTADDLPRHRYKIEGQALALLNDPVKFNALLDQLLADTMADLRKYRIEDPTTLRGYYDFLQTAYAVKGDLKTSLAYCERARALEDREQDKIMRGQNLLARQAALRHTGSEDDPRFPDAFKAALRRQLANVPYEPIKDRLILVRGQAKMTTRELIEASLATQVDPVIAANHGEVPAEVASTLVSIKFTLDFGLRALPWVADVYGEILDAHAGAATVADRWSPRLVSLPPQTQAAPVVIGIWDSGVDTSLYPDQLWTNPRQTFDGKDDDGNGFIDDVHGIAFDADHQPAVGPLASLAGLRGDKEQLIRFIAASEDMQAGLQNDGVAEFQNYVRNLAGEQLRTFTDNINLLSSYVHGTHVAGIAVAGNPFARIVHVTENFPYKEIPDKAPTIEDGARWGASAKQAVSYLKQSGARVVNMSWRCSRAAFEAQLDAKGVGASPAERAELSRKIFAGLRDGLEAAMRSAPDILFVAGSGNEDNDVNFDEYVPAGLQLPNLVTVGAVDDQDKFATFTSTGQNVELYANGYRIESFIPGGQRIKFSGTSMAAPQMSNLAAKLFALRPALTPAQVMKLIRENADPVPDHPGRWIINPKRTVGAIAS